MDERWVGEQIDNWVSDFLIDDAGDRVDREVATHAQGILATFLRHACSIRKVTPDAIEESDVRAGLLEGLVRLSIPEQVQQQVPRLIGDFLADLQRRGRLAGGESHQRVVEVLREEYLRTSRGEVEPIQRVASKIGRNDPCPCGSGRKYKKCCLDLLGDGSK
ncbi:MAG: SEC-C metal-binding domain-containing protein [Planctomycetota bacterium]